MSLLPPNSTPLELAIERIVGDRIDAIGVDTAPVGQLLPDRLSPRLVQWQVLRGDRTWFGRSRWLDLVKLQWRPFLPGDLRVRFTRGRLGSLGLGSGLVR